jgi:hypothetical protein
VLRVRGVETSDDLGFWGGGGGEWTRKQREDSVRSNRNFGFYKWIGIRLGSVRLWRLADRQITSNGC